MKDIVERLEEEAKNGYHIAANRQFDTRALHREAAEEIKKLRQGIIEIRDAVREAKIRLEINE